MAVSASICMPSITARKSSWRRSKRCTAATRTRVTGPSDWPRYRPATRSRQAVSSRQLGGEGAVLVGDVVDHAAEGVDRVHRVAAIRRQHAHAAIERGAGGAHDRLDRVEVGLGGVRAGSCTPSPTRHSLSRAAGEGWGGGAVAHANHRSAATALAAASPLVSRTRRASGSPRRSRRASRCARPTITAVSSRSRRLRVSRGRSTAVTIQRIDPIQQRVEHRAAVPASPPRRADSTRTATPGR